MLALLIYVDGILLMSLSSSLVEEVKGHLHSLFSVGKMLSCG